MNQKKPILQVKGLKTHFFTEDGIIKAVDGLSFQVFPGEVLGMVGGIWLWKKCILTLCDAADR